MIGISPVSVRHQTAATEPAVVSIFYGNRANTAIQNNRLIVAADQNADPWLFACDQLVLMEIS